MCCLVYLRLPTVCFVGDVIIGACAHIVGNTIMCNALLTICESASWYERGVRFCAVHKPCPRLCRPGMCLLQSSCERRSENWEKDGCVPDRSSLCVCVGSSDLATVLIMWDKFWCNYSDLGAEIRNSGILLFVCWNR